MFTLYVVATPIGNLEDITLRALRVLSEVGLIAAEDTRVTRKLLDRYDLRTPMTSFHAHNSRAKLPTILAALRVHDVALVTDAGVPAISDPGAELVTAAAAAGVAVVPLPGASAVTAAVAASGMNADEFVFLGFLPRKTSDRKRRLQPLATETRTMVAFETPRRLRSSLTDLRDVFGDRSIAVCRELTKLHEEVFRGTVSEAIEHFQEPRGEFTMVVQGAGPPQTNREEQERQARVSLRGLRSDGARAKDAVGQVVAETGLSRSRVYRLWLETKSGP